MGRLKERLLASYNRHNTRIIKGSAYSKHTRKSMTRMLGELIKALPKGSRVLDLGCGTGRFINFLTQFKHIDPVGIDVSEPQIEKALEKTPNCKFYRVEGMSFLKDNKGKFDAIFSFDVLEHIEGEDNLLALMESVRDGLNDGGFFVCIVPNGANLTAAFVRYADFTHQRLFTSSSLHQIFEAAGFTKNRVIQLQAGHVLGSIRLYIMRFLHRILFRLCGRGYEKHFDSNICFIGYK